MKKLLAVDGNSILNRAFYGVRPLTTKDGFPTNALYGMVNMISRQQEQLKPDFCAVAFDLKAPTFRHRFYDAYKAGRKPMPEELALQFPVAKELLRAMGFTVLELEGYEADDILGTLAAMCEKDREEAYLMTGDRDALQLISPAVHVLLATNSDTIDMNEDAFQAKYGVASSQFVDVKALMGDSSDNIPGVAGIGEKTACKLIAEYGSLDGVYEALPTAKHTPSVRQKLENGKESAYLSQRLARICREVPLTCGLDGLANGAMDASALRALFLRLEFSGFIKRFSLDAEPAAEQREISVPTVTDATAEEIEKLLDGADVVSLDGEDGILLAVGNRVLRFNEDFDVIVPLLTDKTVICYDCKNLYKKKELQGLKTLKLFDLMLGGYLANSSKSNYALETLIRDYLSEMLPEGYPTVALYQSLYQAILSKLQESGQTKLMEQIEMPLALVLADMETAGFRIDREGIEDYGKQLGAIASALESQIHMQAGTVFNINSPKQLGDVLFDTLGLPHGKKTKTGYSTNAEILEKLRPYHSIVADILDYRQVTKLKSTYTDGLLKVADGEGRVHTTFKQTGTATGRLSSVNPNLQNIPIRTEAGRRFRKYFTASSNDRVLIDADYSQIELRVLAHMSHDEHMTEAFVSGEDIHTATSCRIFGVAPDEVTVEMRKRAKAVNFGILYGMGDFSLSDDLHISRAQAKEYIENYLSSYKGIEKYLEDTIESAKADGYTTTMLSRRRYIPELSAPNKMVRNFGERVARNSPIQGTSADIIKIAMINVDKKLKESGLDARLLLQVHDELLVECPREHAGAVLEMLKNEMENAVKLDVPLKVEAQSGDTWYECH